MFLTTVCKCPYVHSRKLVLIFLLGATLTDIPHIYYSLKCSFLLNIYDIYL